MTGGKKKKRKRKTPKKQTKNPFIKSNPRIHFLKRRICLKLVGFILGSLLFYYQTNREKLCDHPNKCKKKLHDKI